MSLSIRTLARANVMYMMTLESLGSNVSIREVRIRGMCWKALHGDPRSYCNLVI